MKPRCTKCGAERSADARYCGNCGEQTTVQREPLLATQTTRSKCRRTLFVTGREYAPQLLQILGALRLEPAGLFSPNKNEVALKGVRARLRANWDAIDYVCIVGNWRDIEPVSISNPAHFWGDSDAICMSDAPYGVFRDQEKVSAYCDAKPVSRIPIFDEVVLTTLFSVDQFGKGRERGSVVGVSTEVWREATLTILGQACEVRKTKVIESAHECQPDTHTVVASPSWSDDEIGALCNDHIPAIYLFNVHGSDAAPYWVGEGFDGSFPVALTPEAKHEVRHAAMVTEACFGGAMGYSSDSIVETFFARGGAAFFGSSVIAYGSSNQNVTAADLLAKSIINSILKGVAIADALHHAKLSLMVEDGADDIALKTFFSFNAFGVPWSSYYGGASGVRAPWGGTEGTSGILQELRERINIREGSYQENIPTPLLDAIRVRYRNTAGALGDKLRDISIADDSRAKSLADRLALHGVRRDTIKAAEHEQDGKIFIRVGGLRDVEGAKGSIFLTAKPSGEIINEYVSKSASWQYS